MYRLQESRLGRAWMAIREDELAAAATASTPSRRSSLAFALGASTAGFAGVFNASKLTIVSPDQFLFAVSFTVLAMVVLGGMGNIWGVAVGAFVIYTIQAVLLKQLNRSSTTCTCPILQDIDFVQYQFLLYGLALVLMMLFRPEGLFPSQRRRRGAARRRATRGRRGAARAEPGERRDRRARRTPPRMSWRRATARRPAAPHGRRRHQALRRPGRGQRRRLRRSRRARSSA